jgi:predicted nucleic-acid-binding protein
VKVAIDTNVLVRSAVRDDENQARIADEILRASELVAVTLPCLCEFVWVLGTKYKFERSAIAQVIEWLCSAPNVSTDLRAVEAGLSMLRAGGDFADGVIAHQGEWLGSETFVSFDKKAVSLLEKLGHQVELLT